MQTTQRITSLSALAAVGLLALTACGSSSDSSDSSSGSSSSASSASSSASSAGAAQGEGLKVTGAWAKAADSGMTAVFGTIENTSTQEITISSAASPATSSIQLHETVLDQGSGSSRMQQKKGGFLLKPGEKKELKPGGDHIMFMDLKCSLLSGDTIGVTLKTKDGKSLAFEAPIRDYQAAQENYGPSSSSSAEPHPDHGNGNQSMSGQDGSMSGMDHSSGSMDGMKGMGSSSHALPSCGQ